MSFQPEARLRLEGTVLGLVTIGQSPRDDITPQIRPFLPKDLDIRQAGALDGLSGAQVAELAPGAADSALHTRLRDGSPVTVGRARVISRVQACIDRLEKGGADVILLLCTAEFPALHSGALLLEPDRLVVSVVRGLRLHRLGVFLPLASQTAATAAKWAAVEAEKVYIAASPCVCPGEIARAAKGLQDSPVDLIVLDCMGYTEAHRQLVLEAAGKPVVLASSLVARVLGELLCGSGPASGQAPIDCGAAARPRR